MGVTTKPQTELFTKPSSSAGYVWDVSSPGGLACGKVGDVAKFTIFSFHSENDPIKLKSW